VFYFVVPFLQTPEWCVTYYKSNDLHAWIYDCRLVQNGQILYSDLPKLSPWFSASIDFVCIGILVFYVWYKTTWREFSKTGKLRFWLLLIIYVVCTLDLIYSCLTRGFPFLTMFLRPVIVVILLS
jgi:hypothetical protein